MGRLPGDATSSRHPESAAAMGRLPGDATSSRHPESAAAMGRLPGRRHIIEASIDCPGNGIGGHWITRARHGWCRRRAAAHRAVGVARRTRRCDAGPACGGGARCRTVPRHRSEERPPRRRSRGRGGRPGRGDRGRGDGWHRPGNGADRIGAAFRQDGRDRQQGGDRSIRPAAQCARFRARRTPLLRGECRRGTADHRAAPLEPPWRPHLRA